MNNLNESITQIATLIGRAEDFVNQGRYEFAIDYYKQALTHLSVIAKNKNNQHIESTLIKKMVLYKGRAEELEEILKKSGSSEMVMTDNKQPRSNNNNMPYSHYNNNNNNNGNIGPPFTMINNNDNYTNSDENEYESQYAKKELKNLPKVTFDDIIGLSNVKELLLETITLPYEMPDLFTGNRKPAQSILLYGPPGNGKTELARALAGTSKMHFYTISSSDIISKYVGESERNIKSLFDEVKRNKPSILFIDEVDAICSKRLDTSIGDGGGGSKTKSLQEFLVQLDGICEVGLDGVLLLGATNRPWDLDDAMIRRFSHTVYIPMPCNQGRQQLFKKYISMNDHSIDDLEFSYFAGKTDNYSASDIANVCRTAAMGPLRRIKYSTKFHKSEIDGKYTICPTQKLSSSCLHPSCVVTTYKDITNKKLITAGQITFNDVNDALSHIKPSVDLTILARIESWSNKK